MDGITFIPGFVPDPSFLFHYLEVNADWDARMTARKTPATAWRTIIHRCIIRKFTSSLRCGKTESVTGFLPNNCLINFYPDGKSRMGFHSDQTDILVQGTGIVIVSLGETRTLRFRSIADSTLTHDVDLPTGSLLYMTQEVQALWQHAIPATDTLNGRISVTFRKISS